VLFGVQLPRNMQTLIPPASRCCPATVALRSDWDDELRAEKESSRQSL